MKMFPSPSRILRQSMKKARIRNNVIKLQLKHLCTSLYAQYACLLPDRFWQILRMEILGNLSSILVILLNLIVFTINFRLQLGITALFIIIYIFSQLIFAKFIYQPTYIFRAVLLRNMSHQVIFRTFPLNVTKMQTYSTVNVNLSLSHTRYIHSFNSEQTKDSRNKYYSQVIMS